MIDLILSVSKDKSSNTIRTFLNFQKCGILSMSKLKIHQDLYILEIRGVHG